MVFPRRPLVMGILNLTDDSFSGDGTLEVETALAKAKAMIAQGADIIDVGGESARTNRPAISVQEEVARVLPYVERFPECLREESPDDPDQLYPPLLSINTWRPEVAREILPFGGEILNDMSALPTPENARIAATHGVALVIMHSVGEPKVAHTHVAYDDVLEEMLGFFGRKTGVALSAGLEREQIILDPGIDFAKQQSDNLAVYRDFQRIADLGFATLLPVSRKTVIGNVLGDIPVTERDAGTIACVVAGAARGASIFRVHNVAAASQAVKTLWALR